MATVNEIVDTVFIAGSEDTKKERDIAIDVVTDVHNVINRSRVGRALTAYSWTNNLTRETSYQAAQVEINKHLWSARVVVIIVAREVGQYTLGEAKLAFERVAMKQDVSVLTYFKDIVSPDTRVRGAEQIRSLVNAYGGIFHPFEDDRAFSGKLRDDLIALLVSKREREAAENLERVRSEALKARRATLWLLLASAVAVALAGVTTWGAQERQRLIEEDLTITRAKLKTAQEGVEQQTKVSTALTKSISETQKKNTDLDDKYKELKNKNDELEARTISQLEDLAVSGSIRELLSRRGTSCRDSNEKKCVRELADAVAHYNHYLSLAERLGTRVDAGAASSVDYDESVAGACAVYSDSKYPISRCVGQMAREAKIYREWRPAIQEIGVDHLDRTTEKLWGGTKPCPGGKLSDCLLTYRAQEKDYESLRRFLGVNTKSGLGDGNVDRQLCEASETAVSCLSRLGSWIELVGGSTTTIAAHHPPCGSLELDAAQCLASFSWAIKNRTLFVVTSTIPDGGASRP